MIINGNKHLKFVSKYFKIVANVFKLFLTNLFRIWMRTLTTNWTDAVLHLHLYQDGMLAIWVAFKIILKFF